MEEKLDTIINKLEEFNVRINSLEQSRATTTTGSDTREANTQGSAGLEPVTETQQHSENSSTSVDTASSHPTADLSRQFDNLKERLNRVPIPSHLKINDSSNGIK